MLRARHQLHPRLLLGPLGLWVLLLEQLLGQLLERLGRGRLVLQLVELQQVVEGRGI